MVAEVASGRYMSRIASTGLAVALLVGCAQEPAEDEGGAGRRSDPEARPAVSLGWEEPLPDLHPLALDGSPSDALLEPGAWTALALCPIACSECEERLPEWDVRARIWAELGLRFAVVSERSPSLLAETVRQDGLQLPVFATATSIFRLTGSLDEPLLVLVDPEGVVRFVGRRRGTPDERLVSLRRQYQMLSSPPGRRDALVRGVFPDAGRIEIRSSIQSEWLGEAACRLGLSPWYGVAWADGDEWLGVGFPIERDTGCDQCQPLYLMVGITAEGRIQGVEEIEPVISLGERVDTRVFFNRLRGRRGPEGVAKVPVTMNSERADGVTRQLLTAVFHLAARIPDGEGTVESP